MADGAGTGSRHDLEAAIGRVAERFALPAPARGQLQALAEILLSDPHAPTAVRDPLRIVDEHLADSLVALEFEAVRTAATAIDVGSGAGVPGLPLAIALPATKFVLLESSGQKCAFIQRAAYACSAGNVSVVHARAEEHADGLRKFDLATARAVAPPDVVLEYAAPLLKVGGALVVWQGRRNAEAEEAVEKAAGHLGMRCVEIRRVSPFPEATNRHLHLILKVDESPPGFPRRPGIAAKRPLGSSVLTGNSRARRVPSDHVRSKAPSDRS